MAQRATLVVQLLDTLRTARQTGDDMPTPSNSIALENSSAASHSTASSSSTKRSWDSFQSGDFNSGPSPSQQHHIVPPLRVIIETGRNGQSSELPDTDPAAGMDRQSRTRAEQDMVMIRRKRHAMGDTEEPPEVQAQTETTRKKAARVVLFCSVVYLPLTSGVSQHRITAPGAQCTSCGSRDTPEWR